MEHLSDNDTLVWQYEGKRYLLHIQRDEDAESPREFDNLALMACWHRRYDLGDKIADEKPETFWRRMVREIVPHTDIVNRSREGKLIGIRLVPHPGDERLIDIYESVPWCTDDEPEEHLEYEAVKERYLYDYIVDDLTPEQCQTLLHPYAVWLPLWLFDHSGLTISCGERNYPYSDRWDSGQLGWIILSKATLLRETNTPFAAWREHGYEILRSEVEEYDRYLRGEVYGYVLFESVIPEDGGAPAWKETGDSCWGFYGDDIEQNGMMEDVGLGLAESLKIGKYKVGTAKLHTTSYYTFAEAV